jgi:hypothetical protein
MLIDKYPQNTDYDEIARRFRQKQEEYDSNVNSPMPRLNAYSDSQLTSEQRERKRISHELNSLQQGMQYHPEIAAYQRSYRDGNNPTSPVEQPASQAPAQNNPTEQAQQDTPRLSAAQIAAQNRLNNVASSIAGLPPQDPTAAYVALPNNQITTRESAGTRLVDTNRNAVRSTTIGDNESIEQLRQQFRLPDYNAKIDQLRSNKKLDELNIERQGILDRRRDAEAGVRKIKGGEGEEDTTEELSKKEIRQELRKIDRELADNDKARREAQRDALGDFFIKPEKLDEKRAAQRAFVSSLSDALQIIAQGYWGKRGANIKPLQSRAQTHKLINQAEQKKIHNKNAYQQALTDAWKRRQDFENDLRKKANKQNELLANISSRQAIANRQQNEEVITRSEAYYRNMDERERNSFTWVKNADGSLTGTRARGTGGGRDFWIPLGGNGNDMFVPINHEESRERANEVARRMLEFARTENYTPFREFGVRDERGFVPYIFNPNEARSIMNAASRAPNHRVRNKYFDLLVDYGFISRDRAESLKRNVPIVNPSAQSGYTGNRDIQEILTTTNVDGSRSTPTPVTRSTANPIAPAGQQPARPAGQTPQRQGTNTGITTVPSRNQPPPQQGRPIINPITGEVVYR